MITIYDVAKKAGVSIATVSYAINNKNSVSEKTRRRVKEIADEMGFIPNVVAQNLTMKKSNIMGVIVQDISNAYTASFIKYLEKFAKREGFFLLLGSTNNDYDLEESTISQFVARKVDSLVIVPGRNYSQERYIDITDNIKAKGLPFVIVNMQFPNVKANYITTDIEEGTYLMTQYLLKNGHKEIVFTGFNKESYHSILKYSGFERAMKTVGIDPSDQNCIKTSWDFTFGDGYEAVKTWLEDGNKLPQAFIAVSDEIAHGIVKFLFDKGIRVPEDVSVAGNDDIGIPYAGLVPLTTLHAPVEQTAELCLETLMEASQNKKVLRQYSLNQELIVRKSVKSIIE